MSKIAQENNYLFQKALKLHQDANFTDAKLIYRKILKKHPEHIDALFFLGSLLLQEDELESSRILLEKVLKLKPDHAQAYNNLGTVLKELGKPGEAVQSYNKSIALKPDYAMAHCNLGNLLKGMGRYDEAESHCRRAISLQPGYSDAYNNLASTLQKQGKHEEAIEHYSMAIKYNPESIHAHINRSSALLLTENFKEGWPEYEWRLKTKYCNYRNFIQKRWNGSPLNGKTILIHAEQGFGDTIQFVRYLPKVKEQGGYVIFECQNNLIRLLKNCSGIDKIIEMRSRPNVNFDTHIHLLSLPGIFDTNMESIPSDIPYITVDPERAEQWRLKLANNNDLKIGIAWAGRPTFEDHYRSCLLHDFAPLAEIPGITFYSLQKGPASGEVFNPPGNMKIINLDKELTDFAETAAAMNNLDLIISTDTAVVHLAGAIGKPVWTLLHTSSDWRWFLNRENSPWYPGMRLFRQSRFNDWKGVFEQVGRSLLQEINDCERKKQKVPNQSVAHQARQNRRKKRSRNLDNLWQEAVKLHQIGDLSSAIIFYKNIINEQPENAMAHCNLGSALQGTGRIDDAIASYIRARELNPNYAMAHCNLGSVLHESGKLKDAVASYVRAIELSPDFAMAHNNLGTALKDLGKFEEAAEYYRNAIALKPDYAEAYNNLGAVLLEQRKFEDAVRCQNQAISINPEYAEAHNNLGAILQEMCNLDEAIASYRKAIALKPDYAEAHNNLGTALQGKGEPDEALTHYKQAIILKPDFALAHVNRSFALLLTEHFQEGWQEQKWRLNIKGCAATIDSQRVWYGNPLKGKTILIHTEQGFGDTIQFIRYLPMVKEKGGHVILECEQSLSRLLRNCNGIDEIIEKNSTNRLSTQPDFHVQLLDLPGIFETTLNTIPSSLSYITPNPKLVDQWGLRLNADDDFKIGIVWTGSPHHARNRNRSCSLSDFSRLAEIPDVSFYSLQKETGSPDTDISVMGMKIVNLNNELYDFADTAAVIAHLDLVISVDTAVAHLAGALGKPVWTLLPFAPDWRWFLKRNDSPWYPSMSLFRQNQPGDWNGVFEQVKRSLEQEIVDRGILIDSFRNRDINTAQQTADKLTY